MVVSYSCQAIIKLLNQEKLNLKKYLQAVYSQNLVFAIKIAGAILKSLCLDHKQKQ